MGLAALTETKGMAPAPILGDPGDALQEQAPGLFRFTEADEGLTREARRLAAFP